MLVHQSTQQGFYFIESIELIGSNIELGDWLLAYHNDVLVGAREWNGEYTDIPVMGTDGRDITSAYINEGELPNIKVLKSSGELLNLSGELQPWSDGIFNVVGNLMESDELPLAYQIHSIYPNPFNPQTNIVYDMPAENHVDIMVYDLLGRDVESLYNGLAAEGTHTLTWDANHLSSGIYIVKFTSGNTMQSQKVLLLK